MEEGTPEKHWYAMRDLKRSNALLPAYIQLTQAGFKVFTPIVSRLITRNGKQIRQEMPAIQDLLFVYDTKEHLDPIVAKTPTLQYRYKRGGRYCEPITVPDDDMARFIGAVEASNTPRYYSGEELTELMLGRTIRIVGGALNGYEGKLLTMRGSKKRHIVIELSNMLAVSIDLVDEYIEVKESIDK